MKTTIYIIIAIFWLLYTSEVSISFKPFSIEFAKPFTPFAWLFLLLSIVFFQIQSYKNGYREGVDDAFDTLREHVKEMRREEKL
jgi:hypothetical protein